MDKISTSKKNILQYIESKGIAKTSFYETTGISASNFKGKGLNSELGSDKLAKILSCYPDLNIEWVIAEIGEMLKQTDSLKKLNRWESALLKKNKSLEISLDLMAQEIERLRKM